MHIDEVKNNQFYQFPKWLLTEPYIELSHRAMLMYMFLWDRRGLSEKNGWYDEDGKVYIYFTNEQFIEILKCSEPAIIKSKKELTEIGLLDEVRQGINKPNRLYINGTKNSLVQDLKNFKHGTKNSLVQDLKNFKGINTNIINTNISNTTTNSAEKNVFDYYQRRIGSLDGFQYERLKDYIEIDGIEPELVKRAIDRAADNGKRNFSYINKILKNWAQNGIRTIAQQDEEQRSFADSKAKKPGTFERPEYGQGYDPELGF
ncbi:replication initiator protein A [Streptococcus sp.]|uniref:replication initiator protein A n=1 Tax=Streptococcus sp. TaxID=1306 RepID=UPI0035A1B8E0